MKFGKILTGLKIASTLIENEGKINEDVAFNAVFDRRMSEPDSFGNTMNSLFMSCFDDCPNLARYETMRFPSGKNKLCGYLHRPEGKPKALVIYVHGIGGSAFDWYALGQSELLKRGYMVFAIELTASGYSQGYGIPSLSQSAFDVASAVNFIQSRRDLRGYPLFLFGHSWGGYGVAASLSQCKGVKGVASISGFASPVQEMMALPSSKIGGIPIGDSKVLEDALYRRAGINGNLSAVESIRHSNVPLFIAHGKKDSTVPFKGASILAESRNFPNVTPYLDEEADHVDIFFSDEARIKRREAQGKIPEIEKKHGKNPSSYSPELRKQIEAELDKQGCSVLNKKLFDAIDEFYMKHK